MYMEYGVVVVVVVGSAEEVGLAAFLKTRVGGMQVQMVSWFGSRKLGSIVHGTWP